MPERIETVTAVPDEYRGRYVSPTCEVMMGTMQCWQPTAFWYPAQGDAAQAVGASAPESTPPDLAALLARVEAAIGGVPDSAVLYWPTTHTWPDISVADVRALAAALRRQGEEVERGIEGRVSHNFGFSATVNVGAIDWPVGTRVLVRSIQADATRREGA